MTTAATLTTMVWNYWNNLGSHLSCARSSWYDFGNHVSVNLTGATPNFGWGGPHDEGPGRGGPHDEGPGRGGPHDEGPLGWGGPFGKGPGWIWGGGGG